MAMEAEVDRISISVESSTAQAKDRLDKLKKSLKDLDKMANAVNLTKVSDELTRLDQVLAVFSTDRANSMVTVADALNQIKNVRTLNLTRVVSQLNQLADAIINVDAERIRSIANSMSDLRGARTIRLVNGESTTTAGNVAPDGAVRGGSVETTAHSTESVEQISSSYETLRFMTEMNMRILGERVSAVFDRLRTIGVATARAIGRGFAFIGRQALSIATGPIRMLQSAFTRLIQPIKNFFTMFKRRLLYRLINSIISMVTKAFKEGVNTVYQYSKEINGTLAESLDSIATSFLYFKNALGAMVAPVLNALAPVIDRLVDKAVDFLNVINQTIAKLTGAKTWTKALKYPTEYAEAADDAANKVKKLKNTILGIDEINLMNDNSATSTGSKKSQLDYSRMFEEVAVDIDESPMMSKLEKIKTAITQLFKPIRDGWQRYGQPVMENFRGVVKSALDLVSKIFEFVGYIADVVGQTLDDLGENTIIASILDLTSSIFGLVGQILDDIIESDKQSGNLKETFELISGIISGIIGIFTTIIGKIKEALEKGDNGKDLVQSIHDLINEILGFIKDVVDKVVDFLETTDFEPLVKAVTDLNNALKDIVKALRDDLGPIWDNILKPMLKWIIENAIPGALTTIAGALQIIAGILSGDMEKIWSGLEKAAEGVWQIVKPIIFQICAGLEVMTNGLIKFLNTLSGSKIAYVDYTSWYYGNPTVNIGSNFVDESGKMDIPGMSSTYTRAMAEEMAQKMGMSVEEVMAQWNKSGMKYRGYAFGGMPPQGTAFIAGEAGPEIVANINGRSGVMNVEQMSEGVAQGVRDANHEQNALLREQNALLRVLIDKEFSATAIVSTDDIIAGLQRNNRRNGRTIVPVGV